MEDQTERVLLGCRQTFVLQGGSKGAGLLTSSWLKGQASEREGAWAWVREGTPWLGVEVGGGTGKPQCCHSPLSAAGRILQSHQGVEVGPKLRVQ